MDQITVAHNSFRLVRQNVSATIDFTKSMNLASFLGTLDIIGNSFFSLESDGSSSSIFAGISAAGFAVLRCFLGAPIRALTIGGNKIINADSAYAAKGIDVLPPSVSGGRMYLDDIIVNVASPYFNGNVSGLAPVGFSVSQPALPAGAGVGNKVTNNNPYPVAVYQSGGPT